MSGGRYASKTTVPVERSRNEIEYTLQRYGASQFMYGWDGSGAVIAFIVDTGPAQRRQVRFHLPLPSRDERRFTHHSRGPRSAAAAETEWEQACRQRWRALLLVVKAKLEAVESGIATFEDEFLAYIMLPDGGTVGDLLGPQLEAAYDPDKGVMPPGLRLQLTERSGE
jgi:hypothetical protein